MEFATGCHLLVATGSEQLVVSDFALVRLSSGCDWRVLIRP